jgi:hypothetical protein
MCWMGEQLIVISNQFLITHLTQLNPEGMAGESCMKENLNPEGMKWLCSDTPSGSNGKLKSQDRREERLPCSTAAH